LVSTSSSLLRDAQGSPDNKICSFPILIAAFLEWTAVIISNTTHYASAALPDWNFAAAGDWGCTTDTTNTVNNIVNKDPELVLGLGDNSYDDSADCWFDIIQPIDSKMKIVIGNHDDETTTLLTST
jgi:phosphodiesterase/alkaline phosphatase D-like protein